MRTRKLKKLHVKSTRREAKKATCEIYKKGTNEIEFLKILQQYCIADCSRVIRN
jgi:hypothetical protein